MVQNTLDYSTNQLADTTKTKHKYNQERTTEKPKKTTQENYLQIKN